MSFPQPLAITAGDPGGIGPEISVRVAVAARADDRLVLFGDPEWLGARARAHGAPAEALKRFHAEDQFDLEPGQLGLCDAGIAWEADALAHRATPAGGRAQLRTLDVAIAAARTRRVRGLVTGPMSKEAVHLGERGSTFRGHTEHLAQAVGLHDDQVSMMFLGPRLRVGLVTTHISIVNAPAEVTLPRVVRTVRHLAEALLRSAPLGKEQRRPLVLGVAGLNPHAGEAGLFGEEEQRVIEPALRAASQLAPFTDGRVSLRGPIPAETAFRVASQGELDGVVAMLHDQATIASKLLDWGNAVNVTWGLPFVRTSVDHGVAYAAAQSGEIDHSGMAAALHMAQQLTRS